MPFFKRQLELQQRQRESQISEGAEYYENDLVVAREDGSPENGDRVSKRFNTLRQRLELPKLRFHDLRHSAATNIHELTGEFYTISQILGHSIGGTSSQQGGKSKLSSVTAIYVDVRLERKKLVLEAYHNAVLNPALPTE
jgi:integrase